MIDNEGLHIFNIIRTCQVSESNSKKGIFLTKFTIQYDILISRTINEKFWAQNPL